MSWADLLTLVEPHYSKGEMGRKPVGLAIMLRVYFLLQWFSLSDPADEERCMNRRCCAALAGIDLGRAPAPDETTILNFRHLLEVRELCGQMADAVKGSQQHTFLHSEVLTKRHLDLKPIPHRKGSCALSALGLSVFGGF